MTFASRHSGQVLFGLWAGWCIAVFFLIKHALTVYAMACVPVAGLWLLVTGRPGLLTMLATMDFSGKGHRTNLPVGCWPITVVADLATAPFQLPPLVGFVIAWLRETSRRFRVGAAQHSPETLRSLIDKAGVVALDKWEYEALARACQTEGTILFEDIPKLIDLFCAEGIRAHSEHGLLGLITKQDVSDDDLHHILEAEKRRDPYERHLRVLELLASRRDTPIALLRELRELDGAGSHARLATYTIDELEGRERGSSLR